MFVTGYESIFGIPDLKIPTIYSDSNQPIACKKSAETSLSRVGNIDIVLNS